jgi:hypothetical protein
MGHAAVCPEASAHLIDEIGNVCPEHNHVDTLHGQHTQADVLHGPAEGVQMTPGSQLLLQPKSQPEPTVPVRTHLEDGTKQRVCIYVPVVIVCSLRGESRKNLDDSHHSSKEQNQAHRNRVLHGSYLCDQREVQL